MVENIYELKNKIIKQVEKETADMQRMDVKEVGELVDMVKDLAEAEKSCWEASYYRKVTESMGQGSGYSGSSMGGGTGSSAGYGSQQGGSMRQGYGTQSMRQGYGTMGHTDLMEPLRMAIQQAGPDERERLRNEVKTIIGAM